MGEQEFRSKAVRMVANKSNLKEEQIYVVWLTKVLQNNKAVLSTSVDGDGLYFEVTFNGDKNEFYVDTYGKLNNEAIANN